MRSRRWGDMSPAQKVGTVLLAVLQISLAVSAWLDLARRPREQVNGSKRTWAGVIAVNFIGPVLYFWRGRRPAGSATTTSSPQSS